MYIWCKLNSKSLCILVQSLIKSLVQITICSIHQGSIKGFMYSVKVYINRRTLLQMDSNIREYTHPTQVLRNLQGPTSSQTLLNIREYILCRTLTSYLGYPKLILHCVHKLFSIINILPIGNQIQDVPQIIYLKEFYKWCSVPFFPPIPVTERIAINPPMVNGESFFNPSMVKGEWPSAVLR